MINFKYPLVLFLLIIFPLFFILKKMIFKKTMHVPVNLEMPGIFSIQFYPFFYNIISIFSKWILNIGIVLIILAASHPEIINKKNIYLDNGDDFIFVLDTSPSMASYDFDMTRLDKAKELIRNFTKTRPDSSFAIVGFGSEAALIVPSTYDSNFFEKKLSSLGISYFGEGSAIGLGLVTALLHVSSGVGENKIIVLLTDGENNTGAISPITAAHMIRDSHARFFIIGIGKNGESPISYIDPKTKKKVVGTFTSNYNTDILQELANQGNGFFYEARNINSFLNVIEQIKLKTQKTLRPKVVVTSASIALNIFFLGIIFMLFSRFISFTCIKECI